MATGDADHGVRAAAGTAARGAPLLVVEGLGLALPDRGPAQTRRWPWQPPARRTILADIALEVARGECVGLVGESGSGKTTLGRTVMRLYQPDHGRIVFDGQDITRLDPAALTPLRARMQMIFQDPATALNPRRTVGTALVQPQLAYRRIDPRNARARALELLDLVGLPAALVDRYPHQLSGGQRQRVGIARAMALSPDLVVGDEIVSGLDVSTQARILALLVDLRRRFGLSMIFVSHDLSVVRVLCDRVVVLREGRIVETGATARVFARPHAAYTRALLDAIPLPEVDPHWLDDPPADRGTISASPSSAPTESAMKVHGSTVLVTGANRGLGQAFVNALLAAGATRIYAAARDPAALAATVAASGGKVVALALDVTRADQVAAAAAQCRDVNLLVNNAGINRNQAFIAAHATDDALAELQTNYLGTLAMCRAFAPVLKANGGGAIVNVLSILAKVTLPAMGSLCASKAASLRMTEGVRAELAAQGTLVTAVMTGALDTDMSRDFQGPKSAPAEVATAVIAALDAGQEEVYVGPMTEWVNGAMQSDAKGLEKELAKYLPG